MKDVLKIDLEQLGPNHPDTITARQNLGTLARMTNRHADAISSGEKTLEEMERKFGPNSYNTAMCLRTLAESHVELGQFDRAEPRIRRALKILEKEVGPEAYETGLACNCLAAVCQMTGRVEEAEALFRRTVDIVEKRLGPDHPELGNAIDQLAMVLFTQRKPEEAAGLLDRSRRLRRRFLDRTLPALSEDDEFGLLDMGERISRDLALSIALHFRAEPRLTPISTEWVLNSKAVTVRAMARRAVLSRDADNPEAASVLHDLDTTRGRLAALSSVHNSPETTKGNIAEEYQKLIVRERELSRKLGSTLKGKIESDAWATLSEVRDSLPADAVLIEFVRINFDVTNPKGREAGSKTARYGAWIIPPTGGGEVSVVDLGPAAIIEQAVSDALAGIKYDSTLSEADGEQKALAALQNLSDLLVKPLRSHIEPARRWVLSPDASLWLVPWAALPVKKGRYAVEEHLIHLIVSGRDILIPRADAKAARPAIFADPDYNLGTAAVLEKAKEIAHQRTETRGMQARRSPGGSRSLLGTVPRLPHTRDEAEAVKPLMKAYTGDDPEVFLGGAASETVFKSLHGPKALILSTHGFFFNESQPAAEAPSSPLGAPLPALPVKGKANPLLQCGLILAGANNPPGPENGDTDDGYLTGLEVVDTDLRQTELVVLSACVTGLGAVRSGEGIAGLRQSFQIAGADSVVASLWNVADMEAYQHMDALFQGLAGHRGPASSLREAQLALIAERRARLKAAQPYFWAAFTLTGSPGRNWRDEPLIDGGSSKLPTLPRSMPEASSENSGGAISPVTGRREAGGPWSDAALVVVLLAGGSYLGLWWWRSGGALAS